MEGRYAGTHRAPPTEATGTAVARYKNPRWNAYEVAPSNSDEGVQSKYDFGHSFGGTTEGL